jgi:hypothetical protein
VTAARGGPGRRRMLGALGPEGAESLRVRTLEEQARARERAARGSAKLQDTEPEAHRPERPSRREPTP